MNYPSDAKKLNLSIPGDLAQAIASYLMKRPWEEVNHLLARLQQEAKPIVPELKEEPEEPAKQE